MGKLTLTRPERGGRSPEEARGVGKTNTRACACPGCRKLAVDERTAYCPSCEEEAHAGHCRYCDAVVFTMNGPCPACGQPLDFGPKPGK